MKKPCLESHPEFVEGCRLCEKWRDSRYANARDLIQDGPVKPRKTAARPVVALPCIHRGEITGETVGCKTCGGNVQLKLFACAIYGTCTVGKRVANHACCDSTCTYRVDPALSSSV